MDSWGIPELKFSTGILGTYMSLSLITVAVVISIILQQYADGWNSWNDYCDGERQDGSACKSQSAVLRVSFSLAIIFMVQILGTLVLTRFFDYLWVPKIMTFILLVIAFFFVEGHVFDLNGYAWFARILGFLYVCVQGVIVIDVAYSWNEKWVEYSNDLNGGQVWLVGLLTVSFGTFAVSGVALGLMYNYFGGCTANDVILSITVVGSAVSTIVQVFFTEDNSSLLCSAIMTGYCTYLAYAAVTLNPDASCNPFLSGHTTAMYKILGLTVTTIGIVWTGYTAIQRIPQAAGKDSEAGGTFQLGTIGGISPTSAAANPYAISGLKSLFAQVSLVFLLISGYYAMVLTNWATQENADGNNSTSGKEAMWIQAAGQWIAFLFYLWSLLAPSLFPDRDFS